MTAIYANRLRSMILILTHLLLDKMAAILTDDIFKYIFLNGSNFTEMCPQESNWQ